MPALPDPLVTSRPDFMSGTPCFHGTRVPVTSLFDHLAIGYSIDEFLVQFPSVGREHAVAVLVEASAHIVAEAMAA